MKTPVIFSITSVVYIFYEIISENENYNALKESNNKIKDDLVKELESHKMTKKTIAALEVKAKEAEQRLRKFSATIVVLLKENQDMKMTVE